MESTATNLAKVPINQRSAKCPLKNQHVLMLVASFAAICIASVLLDFIALSGIDSKSMEIPLHNSANFNSLTRNITTPMQPIESKEKLKYRYKKQVTKKWQKLQQSNTNKNRYKKSVTKKWQQSNTNKNLYLRKNKRYQSKIFKKNKYLNKRNSYGLFQRAKRKRPKRPKRIFNYCNITNTPSISNLLMNSNQYNILNLTTEDINNLKQMRLTKPKACNQSRQHSNRLHKQNIDLDDENNFVPFINRCKVMNYRLQPDLFEYIGNNNSKIGYIHVFKSGGNTVIETWKRMASLFRANWKKNRLRGRAPIKVYMRWWHESVAWGLQKEYLWLRSKDWFYRNIFDKQYVFSFVRDPLQRFVSSVFEHLVRAKDNIMQEYLDNITDVHVSDNVINALFLMNTAGKILEHRMKCEYSSKYEKDIQYLFDAIDIFWDDHFVPQMHFLLNDEWKPYSLNYVGSIDKIDSALYYIFMEYNDLELDDHELTFEEFKNNYYYHGRERRSKQYQEHGTKRNDKDRNNQTLFERGNITAADIALIDTEQLSDELIKVICELYWVDYICLPFDVPSQCNLTELYLMHYGTDVYYNKCYQ